MVPQNQLEERTFATAVIGRGADERLCLALTFSNRSLLCASLRLQLIILPFIVAASTNINLRQIYKGSLGNKARWRRWSQQVLLRSHHPAHPQQASTSKILKLNCMLSKGW